jgi:serine/threonine protein kinase
VQPFGGVSRTTTVDRFTAGSRIGDYAVEQEVAIEETGMVYLGRHVVLPRQASIKVMHASDAWIRSVAVQMLREACLIEALSHPGIPRVYECGVLGDKRPWTAFEHVEGVSIGSLIADTPMAVADVVVFVRDVADILDHCHHRGVMHRKLTAESVIKTPNRRFPVSLRHWGDACALDHGKTPAEPRDDVRALGKIAFRALTGARPATNGSTAERYPGAPHDVAALVDSMLAKDPAARPSSGEVRDRAKWLADTLELVPAMDKPRWTPPHGLDDSVPNSVEEVAAGFTIRIAGRTPTRR